MSATYEARGFIKYAEEDTFQNGCDPDSTHGFDSDSPIFSGDTPAAVIADIAAFLGVHPDDAAISLDACDEPGRVDVQMMERDDGQEASAADVDAWKARKIRLWLVDYSFQIERVSREAVTLGGAAPHTLYGCASWRPRA